MTHEIVKTENYLLVVDDSEIKKGDWFYNRVLSQSIKVQGVWLDKVDNLNSNLETFKVIAHLPLNNSPFLEGVDVLPPFTRHQEDGIEELAELNGHPESSGFCDYKEGFLDGFLEAKEKYRFTYEDIDKAYWAGMKFIGEDKGSHEEFIQSLSQPKIPIAFECEESIFFATNAFSSDITLTAEGLHDTVLIGIKKTTNSQGQTQWVGKYIYA